jgi:predicted dehydrogenase
VRDPQHIRLAMLGMIPGNGHPFSWSAIVNGTYDAQAMEDCGYPVIPRYLAAAPREEMGLPGVQVTHVWCDDPADGPRVAKAAAIPHVVKQPEDVIGQVDAVLIATDDGSDHVRRARPFIEAGVPVFVDKPLVDNLPDLSQFLQWHEQGQAFLSSSGMRYSQKLGQLKNDLAAVGQLRLIHVTMCKTWARYGIHAIECVYHMLPPGRWQSIQHVGREEAKGRDLFIANHQDDLQIIFSVISDMTGAFGHVDIYGTQGHIHGSGGDTFTAFRRQLVSYIEYLRTGVRPVPIEQTVEQMKLVIGGLESQKQNGRIIALKDIQP